MLTLGEEFCDSRITFSLHWCQFSQYCQRMALPPLNLNPLSIHPPTDKSDARNPRHATGGIRPKLPELPITANSQNRPATFLGERPLSTLPNVKTYASTPLDAKFCEVVKLPETAVDATILHVINSSRATFLMNDDEQSDGQDANFDTSSQSSDLSASETEKTDGETFVGEMAEEIAAKNGEIEDESEVKEETAAMGVAEKGENADANGYLSEPPNKGAVEKTENFANVPQILRGRKFTAGPEIVFFTAGTANHSFGSALNKIGNSAESEYAAVAIRKDMIHGVVGSKYPNIPNWLRTTVKNSLNAKTPEYTDPSSRFTYYILNTSHRAQSRIGRAQ
jgi:hypothetical protein